MFIEKSLQAAWPAQSVERVALDRGLVSASPTLGVALLKNKTKPRDSEDIQYPPIKASLSTPHHPPAAALSAGPAAHLQGPCPQGLLCRPGSAQPSNKGARRRAQDDTPALFWVSTGPPASLGSTPTRVLLSSWVPATKPTA